MLAIETGGKWSDSRLLLAVGDSEGSRVTIVHAPPSRFDAGEKVDEDAEHCVRGFFCSVPLPSCCRWTLGGQFCDHFV